MFGKQQARPDSRVEKVEALEREIQKAEMVRKMVRERDKRRFLEAFVVEYASKRDVVDGAALVREASRAWEAIEAETRGEFETAKDQQGA